MRAIVGSVERLRKAIRRYGVAGTLRELRGLAHERRQLRNTSRVEREYDERHGVDTAGIARLQYLDIPSDNRQFGNRYQGAQPEILRALIRALDIDYSEYSFVDYGSGKGRALFVASEFPFRRIVGIEFSPELDEVAQRNIRSFRSEEQRCEQIEAFCMDAAAYDLPDESAVLYFNNPFEKPVMRDVLARIGESVRDRPRSLLLVLMGDSQLASVIEDAGFRRLPVTGLPAVVTEHPESRGLFEIVPGAAPSPSDA